MQVGMVEGCTRVIGESQGYRGLPLRDDLIHCSVNGSNIPSMTSAWYPTPEEIAAIAAGAPVHLRILGVQHPPVMVSVGAQPSDPTEG